MQNRVPTKISLDSSSIEALTEVEHKLFLTNSCTGFKNFISENCVNESNGDFIFGLAAR